MTNLNRLVAYVRAGDTAAALDLAILCKRRETWPRLALLLAGMGWRVYVRCLDPNRFESARGLPKVFMHHPSAPRFHVIPIERLTGGAVTSCWRRIIEHFGDTDKDAMEYRLTATLFGFMAFADPTCPYFTWDDL